MKIEHDQIVSGTMLDIPEHQVLLSFNNDNDGMAFFRWWREAGGRDLFVAWAEKIDFDITMYSGGVLPVAGVE